MDVQVKLEAMEEDWNAEADEYVVLHRAEGKSVDFCPPTKCLPPGAHGVKYGKKKKLLSCSAAPGPSN